MNPIIPPEIEAVIAKFDQTTDPFDEGEIKQALIATRQALADRGEAERLGAWAEVLAFALTESRHSPSPWNTYFGPVSSGTLEDGKPFYSPDIAGTDAEVVAHWARRARDCKHPVLRARYADLCWDMSRAIANANPDPDMARLAIDSYLASLEANVRRTIHDEFEAAIRALDLAQMLRDASRVDAAKGALLRVHRKSVEQAKGLWWKAYDRLMDDKNARLTDQERDQLVSDLEALAIRFSTISDPGSFDPHAVQNVAERLVPYYNRNRRREDVIRLNQLVARSFEHAASLASPMLASSFLHTALSAYREVGLADDSKRVRVAMEEKIEASRSEMHTFTFETTIAKEDMDKFLAVVVTPDVGDTFVRIASEFLDRRETLEDGVKKMAEESPLMAVISQSVMAERHVAATVGSVEDDSFGRLIQHAARSMAFTDIWLTATLDRAVQVHGLTPHHFVGWVMRASLLSDASLLAEGVRAWFAGDFVKAVHILVPQIEVALRGVAGRLGRPTTKAHQKISGVSVVVNMGDILYSREIIDGLGDDIALHFQAIYSDPRGLNIRNDMAHGILSMDQIDENMANKIIHTLLILGIWDHLAAARKRRKGGGNPESAA